MYCGCRSSAGRPLPVIRIQRTIAHSMRPGVATLPTIFAGAETLSPYSGPCGTLTLRPRSGTATSQVQICKLRTSKSRCSDSGAGKVWPVEATLACGWRWRSSSEDCASHPRSCRAIYTLGPMSTSRKIFILIVVAVGLVWLNRALQGRPTPATSASSAPSALHQETSGTPCTAADFSISKARAMTEYDEATLTGVVTNHCKSSAGIRLKWTAYNSDGTVAFSNDFWPASTTNIAPGRDYPFQMMNTAPRGKWTYEVEPVSVDIW